jgi:hypothetical protein
VAPLLLGHLLRWHLGLLSLRSAEAISGAAAVEERASSLERFRLLYPRDAGSKRPTLSGDAALPRTDEPTLRAAAEAFVLAREEYEAAKRDAEAAYERLEARPDTIEYRIDWNLACKHEAECAWRLREARETYRKAGGYLAYEE